MRKLILFEAHNLYLLLWLLIAHVEKALDHLATFWEDYSFSIQESVFEIPNSDFFAGDDLTKTVKLSLGKGALLCLEDYVLVCVRWLWLEVSINSIGSIEDNSCVTIYKCGNVLGWWLLFQFNIV